MSRRTITENEISLIKAMLAREMKNKDIQFFFNRPERPVNSGRISTIRSGSYSNSAKILAASDAELDAFLATERSERGLRAIASGTKSELSVAEKARAFFKKSRGGGWILAGGENQECECKQ